MKLKFTNATRVLAFCLLVFVILNGLICRRTESPPNFILIGPEDSLEDVVRKAAQVVPSPRQLSWQEMEFTGFLHFTVNTFTDREWGTGKEEPALFNPTELDTRQWVKVCKDAGMKQLILTAKHHDGFCLWPSRYTEHSIKNSPWRDGKGDVVRELSDACREAGLKFGVYLSPWDRHEPTYGNSPAYNAFFKNQLRELLTEYGPISEVWFDGACGEGPDGRRQVYDWEGYYRLIRLLQPQTVIAIMGPDVRWVGTETGYGRETEWSVVPVFEQELKNLADDLVHHPFSIRFIPQGDRVEADLGSREKLKSATALAWYPSEVDVSIRPGWFYHSSQDNQVKTPEKLVDIYYSSVGRNSLLLLNIPPDRRGLIHENDSKSLQGMRAILEATFQTNFSHLAKTTATSEQRNHEAVYAVDQDKDTYWSSEDRAKSATLEFELKQEQAFNRALLQEYIQGGQRVEEFLLQAWNGSNWVTFAKGTTVGYKRLLRFPLVTAKKIRLIISKSRAAPTISEFGLFKSPLIVSE
ncbi:MAG: alpha-L-fucosidase [Candidatus Aminicenantes bacterium]|nr:alpha-L-fucosidase [Candidatus Aminicenantes bacterium]